MAKARGLARRIVLHHFGRRARRIQYQPGGLSNFVFLVYHAAGEFVVRICPRQDDLAAFLREQWAINHVRQAGVPTPEVLVVGQDIVPWPYMLTRRVVGHEASFHPARTAILAELGRYAAAIHQLPTRGIGSVFDWHARGPRFERWADYLEGELHLSERLAVLARARMLPDPVLQRIGDLLRDAGAGTWQPVLNHGDLRPKNVLVDDDGTITALLDWEDCVSSLAPHWDLSLALHDLGIDERQAFVTGYGLRPADVAAMSPVLKAMNLVNYAPRVAALTEEGDAAELAWYRARLGGALDLHLP